MSDTNSFYVTTPIFYPNGEPHIGHAYTDIASDMLARYHRLDGKDVFFLTGTDEHGQKMQQTAEKEGISPLELADRNSAVFRTMAEALSCSNDDFVRTTEERHKIACQTLWKLVAEKGDLYLGKYDGWYSVRQEGYFDESETIVGEDGVRREKELGSPVEWVEEESYFFKLSAYQDKLLAHYEANLDFIGPDSRRNEVISFVKSGLRDLSVSRTTFDWGVPVPDDDRHVMYVWIDALTNYLTGTGWPQKGNRSHFWPADVHIIGKDIIRFHAVYWPAFLMAAGVELPKRIFAHGFLFNRGEKMSKSVGNVIDPFSLAKEYGVDQLRYFLLSEVPFGQDGNYSHSAIINRINADLANDLGNLAQRSLSMIAKNCEGRVPEAGEFWESDKIILAKAYQLLAETRPAIECQKIHKALELIWKVVADANKYFAGNAPWALKKTDPERMNTVLYVTAELIRVIAIMAQPVMPESCGRLLDLLCVDEQQRNFSNANDEYALTAGSNLPAPQGVFPRYVEKNSKD
ncbi:MAG: methionine--tRNA ligase [Hyphomicrobiales bacterium]|nr:methionine--tRNA ligase [Hyphomicrobiales bacterium]